MNYLYQTKILEEIFKPSYDELDKELKQIIQINNDLLKIKHSSILYKGRRYGGEVISGEFSRSYRLERELHSRMKEYLDQLDILNHDRDCITNWLDAAFLKFDLFKCSEHFPEKLREHLPNTHIKSKNDKIEEFMKASQEQYAIINQYLMKNLLIE